MKRYRDLYRQVYDLDNIRIAHENARKGKLHYREVKKVDASPDRYYKRIHYMLKNKTFHNSRYKTFQHFDGRKTREIYKLPYFPDRIIHHCIMQVVEPIWTNTLIKDTFACVKGRGIHKGVRRVQSALTDVDGTKYCLKCDVRKFYPSVDHLILRSIIRKKIKDRDLLWLLDGIVESAPGIPIGNYLSQHFGNLYLSELDHRIKEKERCKYYFRYCDDMVVLHKSKRRLNEIKDKIVDYLKNLRLELKGNWQIFPVDSRGIDFLGYRFFHNYILLRKSIAYRFRRKMRRLTKHCGVMKPVSVLSTVMSYYGWMKCANCLYLTKKYINIEIFMLLKDLCVRNRLQNPLNRLRAIGICCR